LAGAQTTWLCVTTARKSISLPSRCKEKKIFPYRAFLFLADVITVLTEPCSILHGWIAVRCLGSNSRIPSAFKPAKSKLHLAAQPPHHIVRVYSPIPGLGPRSWPHASAALHSQPGLSPSDFPGCFPKYKYYACTYLFFNTLQTCDKTPEEQTALTEEMIHFYLQMSPGGQD